MTEENQGALNGSTQINYSLKVMMELKLELLKQPELAYLPYTNYRLKLAY